jgi:hypothetical protein
LVRCSESGHWLSPVPGNHLKAAIGATIMLVFQQHETAGQRCVCHDGKKRTRDLAALSRCSAPTRVSQP